MDSSAGVRPSASTTCSGSSGSRVEDAAAGLVALCLFLFGPVLALVPLGLAPLAGIAGAASIALVRSWRTARTGGLAVAGFALWAALSAAWSVAPAYSLGLAIATGAMLAAGLILVCALSEGVRHAARWRAATLAGWLAGLAFVAFELQSHGALHGMISDRPFDPIRLNRAAIGLLIVAAPVLLVLAQRFRTRLAGAAAAALVAMAAVTLLFALQSTTAKWALAVALAVAGFAALAPQIARRVLAATVTLVVCTAPLVFGWLGAHPEIGAMAADYKPSLWHRLAIWAFVSDRIGESPFLGWGMGASRYFPGGTAEIAPGAALLPLHPHNAPLQAWLELGAPGALALAVVLSAAFRLGPRTTSPARTACAVMPPATALVAILGTWGLWQAWWLGTLAMATAITVLLLAPDPARDPVAAPTAPPLRAAA